MPVISGRASNSSPPNAVCGHGCAQVSDATYTAFEGPAAESSSLKNTHGHRKNTSTAPWPQCLVVDEGYRPISSRGSPYVKGFLAVCAEETLCTHYFSVMQFLIRVYRCHCLIYQADLATARQQWWMWQTFMALHSSSHYHPWQRPDGV